MKTSQKNFRLKLTWSCWFLCGYGLNEIQQTILICLMGVSFTPRYPHTHPSSLSVFLVCSFHCGLWSASLLLPCGFLTRACFAGQLESLLDLWPIHFHLLGMIRYYTDSWSTSQHFLWYLFNNYLILTCACKTCIEKLLVFRFHRRNARYTWH